MTRSVTTGGIDVDVMFEERDHISLAILDARRRREDARRARRVSTAACTS
ncbi:MAG: hypothetical protein H0T79_02515 [Deltaproteobacteria bacterium]|nr:hypothetical protein [Deltaproteobacteria bacterium]